METGLCSSGFVPISSSRIHRKAFPSFPTQEDSWYIHGSESSYCVQSAPAEHQQSQAPSAEYFDTRGLAVLGISKKLCVLWGCWLQSHLHRFVMELLHEQLWDWHFCTYGKVKQALLLKANLESLSWRKGMWEGTGFEERNVCFVQGSTITHCLMSIRYISYTS